MNKLAPLCTIGVLFLAACGKSSGPAPSGSASADPKAPPSAAPAAPVASGEAPQKPADTSAYAIVAVAPNPIVVTAMKGGAIAQISNVTFALQEGPLVQEPNFTRGIKKTEWGSVLGGEWPKSAWIEAQDAEGNTKLYKYFDSLGGRWEPQQVLRENERLLDLAAVGDNVIAVIAMPGNDIRMQLVGGKGGVIPAPFPSDKPAKKEGEGESPSDEPSEADMSCKVKMNQGKYTMAGTPDGYAFAAGYTCVDSGGSGPAIAERWEPKKARGSIDTLPAPPSGAPGLRGVLAVSASEAYVYGDTSSAPYLAKWDGKAWALDSAPVKTAEPGRRSRCRTNSAIFRPMAAFTPAPRPTSGWPARREASITCCAPRRSRRPRQCRRRARSRIL
jgi:hypothetical protein